MRDIEESHRCSAVCSNVIVYCPVPVIVFKLFVVWIVCLVLGKRVGNAFVEDFVSVVWLVGPLCTRNRVREAQIVQQSWQVIREEPDTELGVYEVLYLLFLSGFTFFEQAKNALLLHLVELRGPAPEARRKDSETALIPEIGPATSS